MRTIVSGDKSINIRASNLTHMFFHQEFGTELRVEVDKIKSFVESQHNMDKIPLDANKLQDIYKLQNLNSMPPKEAQELLERNADMIKPLLNLAANKTAMSMPMDSIMRVVWAMNRCQDFADNKMTKPFNEWIVEFDEFDFESNFQEICQEIERGFFRSENK